MSNIPKRETNIVIANMMTNAMLMLFFDSSIIVIYLLYS